MYLIAYLWKCDQRFHTNLNFSSVPSKSLTKAGGRLRLCTKKDKMLKRMTTFKGKYQRKCARQLKPAKELQPSLPTPSAAVLNTPQPSCPGDASTDEAVQCA